MRDWMGRVRDRMELAAFNKLPEKYQQVLAARCAGWSVSRVAEHLHLPDRVAEEILTVALRSFARRRRYMRMRRIALAIVVTMMSCLSTAIVVTAVRASAVSTSQGMRFHGRRRRFAQSVHFDRDPDDLLYAP